VTEAAPPTVNPGGRTPAWRLGMGLAGLALVAAAAGIVWRPQILAYVAAAGLGALGLLLIVSAVAARGPDRSSRP
jgi:hypothetical protein